MLTLPASFDEVARELTVEAAKQAGLPRVVLIEEPQAAFYAWIYKHADDWDDGVAGTEDPGLRHRRRHDRLHADPRRARGESARKVQFHRVAVGEHLILGGDNLDLALAHHLEQRLTSGGRKASAAAVGHAGARMPAGERDAAGRESAGANDGEHRRGGSRLIGGLQIEVTREEVRELLVEGFFPRVALDDKPAARPSGFQEFGLPYAPDAAITRYLAAFLTAHRNVTVGDEPLPDDHDPGAARHRAVQRRAVRVADAARAAARGRWSRGSAIRQA